MIGGVVGAIWGLVGTVTVKAAFDRLHRFRRSIMKTRIGIAVFLGLSFFSIAEGAPILIDGGFEDFAVTEGAFLAPPNPGLGPWQFGNNAGVVDPYSPPSSSVGVGTWTATFAPIEGEQYASTYAGLDTLTQSVMFDTAGDYLISVYAAAPRGTVVIPPNPNELTLVAGQFEFTLDGAGIGSLVEIQPGAHWQQFDASFTIDTPGLHTVGVRNTRTAPYFINYDAFSLVPEPSTGLLIMLGGGLVAIRRRRRECRNPQPNLKNAA